MRFFFYILLKLIIFLLFVATSIVQAGPIIDGYPGECSVVNLVFSTSSKYYVARDGWTINPSTGNIDLPTGYNAGSPTTVQLVGLDSWFFENGSWHLAGTMRSIAFFSLGPYDTSHSGGGAPWNWGWYSCADLPDCTAEYNAKIQECGSVQKIIHWNNISCTGNCCLDANQNDICDSDEPNNFEPPPECPL